MGIFLITGTREFGGKPLAFRNDFCRHCHAGTLAIRTRTHAFGTLFWVPLLPLGPRRRWVCLACGQPTHTHPGPKRSHRFLLAAVLALFLASLLSVLPGEPPDTRPVLIAVGAALALGTLWLLYLGFTHRPAPDWAPLLAGVEPYRDHQCPLCLTPLHLSAEGAECRTCHISHQPLNRPG